MPSLNRSKAWRCCMEAGSSGLRREWEPNSRLASKMFQTITERVRFWTFSTLFLVFHAGIATNRTRSGSITGRRISRNRLPRRSFCNANSLDPKVIGAPQWRCQGRSDSFPAFLLDPSFLEAPQPVPLPVHAALMAQLKTSVSTERLRIVRREGNACPGVGMRFG